MAQPSQQAQEIVAKYNAMRQHISNITQKIAELDAERNEHDLVVKALTPMDGDRTCYRMTGGVITQRTVKEVLPAVQKNLEGIEALIKSLVEQLKAAEKEAEEFRVQHNIRFQRAAPAGSSGAGSSESSSGEQASGILI